MHDHHDHHHGEAGSSMRALSWALAINAFFLVVEFIGGLLTNSLALLADAGHMLTDVTALVIAIIAAKIAARAATRKRTYGYGRVKVLAALMNGLALWLIVGVILWEALHRMGAPPEIKSLEMMLIASLGLLANLGSALVLRSHSKGDINVRGAFVHLMADSLGSVGAILAGALILWKGWFLVDPIISIVISGLILWSSTGIIKDSVRILLESTPRGLKLDEIQNLLESFPGVKLCHDLHVWLIGSDQPILTAHLVISENTDQEKLLTEASHAICDRYGITHSTIQLETESVHPDLGCHS